MDKYEIIRLKQEGLSNREVARRTGWDRDTVSKYWNEYRSLESELSHPNADVHTVQDALFAKPEYDSTNRRKRKYNEEIDTLLREILKEDAKKNRMLGAGHKQKLTNKQIYAKVLEAGHEICIATVNAELARLRKKQREVFVRQEYELGQRLEYDFGEVRLDCGEGTKVYHMAVFCSPASSFRWLYLYTNQKKDVFLDSHVKLFELLGGCYGELVYDNMRNVVRKFIGRTEKELNPDLLRMSLYYGFRINVTNCFRGNEKGSVERSVDVLRNQLFAEHYKFCSLDAAEEYAHRCLTKMNEDSLIKDEKAVLLPYKPPLELAEISENTVNSYSLICVDTVFYSVPEEWVGKSVTVKKYHDEIRVFSGSTPVCKHRRAFGNGTYQIDIYHYLNTLHKKPGALKNSAALKRIPKLKSIFDTHYADKPRRFIELFMENRHLAMDELLALFEEKTFAAPKVPVLSVVRPVSEVSVLTRASLAGYAQLVTGGASRG